jgi:hypothetical protein
MNRHKLAVLCVLAAIAGLVVISAQRADAIPAFARKYQFSCSTCHAPFPRLKPFGDEFAGRGFRMEDPSKEPTRETYDVGDPLLRLVRTVPLAIRFDVNGSWKEDKAAESDFESPWVFKILSGGPISDKAAYYLYFIAEKGEVVGLEDAWIALHSVFGAPVDLQIGQFQVCDPMFKRETRLERYDYQIFKTHVGASHVDLTYDRGLVASIDIVKDLDVIVQIVNGNGMDAADDFSNFDRDSFKNYSLRLAYSVGKARIGVFGYSGRERGETGEVNQATYFGPDLVVGLGDKWELAAEYLERRDDNPHFLAGDVDEITTRGGFVELQYFPQGQDGRWALSALYNNVDSDALESKFESASLTANYLVARNLRLFLEGGRELEVKQSRFTVGLITAF